METKKLSPKINQNQRNNNNKTTPESIQTNTTKNNKTKITEYFEHPEKTNIKEKDQKTSTKTKINNKKPARIKNPQVEGLGQMKKAMSRFIIRNDSCTQDKSHEDKIVDYGSTNRIRDGSTLPAQDGEIAEFGFPGNLYFQRSPLRQRLNLKVKTLVIPMLDRL